MHLLQYLDSSCSQTLRIPVRFAGRAIWLSLQSRESLASMCSGQHRSMDSKKAIASASTSESVTLVGSWWILKLYHRKLQKDPSHYIQSRRLLSGWSLCSSPKSLDLISCLTAVITLEYSATASRFLSNPNCGDDLSTP